MDGAVDNARGGEKRGRQYQVPKRYEFQKNIPHSRDSSAQTSVFKPNFTVNKLRRDESTNSFSLQAKRTHSPHLLPKTDPLTEYKRHSLSLASGGGSGTKSHILNAYNDTKVFETVAPMRSSSSNYVFDQKPVQEGSYPGQLPEPRNKSILISRPESGEAPAFSSSISKINYYQSEADLPRFMDQAKRHSARAVVDASPGTLPRLTPGSTDNTTRPILASAASHSDDTDTDIPAVEASNPYLDTLDGPAVKHSPSTTQQTIAMRTQQRQLAMKDLMLHTHTAGSAWFELAAADRPQLDESVESIDAGQQQNVWANVSVEERNRYEQISNDLRKLALYNKKPMMDSIGRYLDHRNRNSQLVNTKTRARTLAKHEDGACVDSKGLFKHGMGRELAEEIWNSANSNYRFSNT
ncbi:hypothetical protein OGAPHI_004988 [Ogataea philodendri]|uniref:Uncharacterized protein n=1 Tax=Ogataea philodendri TaxID=1378263 RepID=A0A9P8P1P0_9ASCO|nr:uncharacterized protein OGAPHI_004988 [Ogataea philodendri]KAH3663587.1 hypothetical protein OGAPHI_004988 [Ogataea philodendri]